ncbi:hypothetical protein HPB52_002201 [Rhipicephalus sanguineus]|uniref:HTH psq-type domain-containing protein n=1 Tax=Rhipicephalus sanguineus TaxID=34632 RepID=A0A9D4QBI5_RHISA|nr:hypothetical protein HPB52_002201 [Rhipicephalus sanguineus]
MLSQKGPACSAAEQSAYLLSWFGEYSDLQRDDFLHVLAEKYTPLGPAGDGALGLSHLAIVNPDAPPSLFQCRMSLFDQWFQFGRHSARIVTYCASRVCSIGFYVLDAMAPPSAPSREPGGVKKRGKYTTLTLEKKIAIVKLIESGRSQLDVAKEYNLSKQTVSDYVKNRTKILTAFENSSNKFQKNDSKGVHSALEEALKLWLKGVLSKNLPVSGDLLKEKAEAFALKMSIQDFKFTDGAARL